MTTDTPLTTTEGQPDKSIGAELSEVTAASEPVQEPPPALEDAQDSYIVRQTIQAIRLARKATPYSFIAGKLLPAKHGNWRFVDTWVLSHVALAACAWLAIGALGAYYFFLIPIAYGALRTWEVAITAMDVMLGGRPDAEFTVRSVRRSLILGVLNYVEVMFWFAAAYAYFSSEFGTNAVLVRTITGSFYYSILTMTTYGDISPQTTFGRWLVTVHLLLSIYLTIGVLGRLVSTLPRPRSRDWSEE